MNLERFFEVLYSFMTKIIILLSSFLQVRFTVQNNLCKIYFSTYGLCDGVPRSVTPDRKVNFIKSIRI